MSALLGYCWMSPLPFWAWVAGMAMGGGIGTLLGHWLTLVTLRNPLGTAVRAYRELWRDVAYLWATGNLRAGR